MRPFFTSHQPGCAVAADYSNTHVLACSSSNIVFHETAEKPKQRPKYDLFTAVYCCTRGRHEIRVRTRRGISFLFWSKTPFQWLSARTARREVGLGASGLSVSQLPLLVPEPSKLTARRFLQLFRQSRLVFAQGSTICFMTRSQKPTSRK